MSNDIVKRADGTVVKVDSIDFQMEMFKKAGLSPTMVETHKFEKRGDCFVLAKRERRITIFDDGNGGMVAMQAMTESERVGLNKARGKYNDENRLFDQDSASLKVGEVAAWSTL